MCWVADEIRTADLGDARLNERMGKILQALGDKPNCRIPQAMGGWSETIAAYRFFDNKKATYERVLKPHYAATLERIKQQAVVLLPQDTTDFIHVVNKGSKGIGTLKKTEKDEIFFHPVLAITPDKLPLGTISVQLWKRSKQSIRAERQNKPIEEKESYCWIEGYQAACDIQAQAPETLIVSIGDRESDIYEFFIELEEYVPKQRAEWIVRAAQDRCLEIEEGETTRTLFEKMKEAPILGEVKFSIPAREGKAARPVRQAVRAATVKLAPPERRGIKGFKLPTTTVNVVFAEEINPPEHQEPVNWLILTSLPVDSFEQAELILKWYLARWEIEIFFRVLKQGCNIEKLQFETEKRFAVCLAFYIIIAWRVLHITMLGREYPNLDCEVLFDKSEWQTLYIVEKGKLPPEEPLPLSVVVLMLAKLGGFLGRKHDGFPGPKAIWIGLQRLRDSMWAIQQYQTAASLACAGS